MKKDLVYVLLMRSCADIGEYTAKCGAVGTWRDGEGNEITSGHLCAISGALFCRADEFICNNTLCKLHTWVCDGKDDCGDNSDEDDNYCSVHTCKPSEFR